ncbi:unnamed protein product [Bursaphelenchus okinawaensis]|uniref:Uncharacterized protein n=1 Tax=Bursaphelenchus okinawaensis TaxID=465554 RepID=A0A811KM74_9BILA|nr:unnamed protein product [Bursaphelenchus okinawaensis]CAG9106217.1 unnamed protein product [Bursaphelenchus okinawaensis]
MTFPTIWLPLLLFISTVLSQNKRSFSLISDNDAAFCVRTVDCIEKVKKLVPQTNNFWFGDTWKLHCGGFSSSRREHNPIKCMNPRELSAYHSLGGRLFHARTFTAAYLQNLAIYPRMTFTLQSGQYRGCDHDFIVECNRSQVIAHPEMEPLQPFLTRVVPEISWPELGSNESNVIMLLDAGFGLLKYLVVDYPRNPKVIVDYETVDNFRPNQPTPLVLLVFRGSEEVSESIKTAKFNREKMFLLTNFMMEHGLEADLIGINWALIGSDAYAMERQRLKGSVDNCHSLVQKKLQKEKLYEFTELFLLSEMDSSLSVSFSQPKASFEVCCKHIQTEEKDIFVDPLDSGQTFPTLALRKEPVVTSMRSIEYETDNYQRSLRHYIALKEDRFTIVLFDPHRHYLHWFITDIPAGSLAAGTIKAEGNVIAPYVPPVPGEFQKCIFPVMILFRQPRSQNTPSEISQFYGEDHVLRSTHCKGHCVYRSAFDIAQFKSFHRLRLSAMSWFKVCFDFYEAHRRIEYLKSENGTKEMPRGKPGTKYVWRPQQDPNEKRDDERIYLKAKMAEICSAARQGEPHNCDIEPSSAFTFTTTVTTVLLALFTLLL